MKWIWALCLIAMLGTVIAIIMQSKPECQLLTITTPSKNSVSVELAKIESAWQKGLSGRKSLPPQTGMLFLFPSPDIYSFWMKDTLIPLDIIWLNNKQVVDLTTLEPATADHIPQYTPTSEADTVLEINKGEAAKLGIIKGTQLHWNPC
jgi:uncharacterized protein